MFTQDIEQQPVRDFVFPVGNLCGETFILQGTAFFVGDRGIAITAGHVIEALFREPNSRPVALFIDGSHFVAKTILSAETHDVEDVGVLKVDGVFRSIFRVVPDWEGSSRDYDHWGYPERVAHELRGMTPDSTNSVRPDLIYSRGYIRRRISRELHVSVYRGTAFYELSEVAGSCCSGGPILRWPRRRGDPWDVIGVYIGEETGGAIPHVGFATRCDALREWIPDLIGTQLSNLPVLPAREA